MQTKIGVAQSIATVALLAKQQDNKPLKSHIISQLLHVSDAYLKKIIRKLVVAGILHSSASRRGGLSLKKTPEEITFLDIFEAIEGEQSFFNSNSILEYFTHFNDNYFLEKGSRAISYFAEAENNYKKILQSYTIADLIDSGKEGEIPLDLNQISFLDLKNSSDVKELVQSME